MKIKLAIVDERIPADRERSLMLLGYRVVSLPPSKRLGRAVASHPDMLIARLGRDYITTTDYLDDGSYAIQDIYDLVHPIMHFADEMHGESYPGDCILNSLVLGRTVYARLDTLSPYLKELAQKRGYILKNISQGYAACTTLRLSDEAVITADEGVARVLLSDGIRVYKIKNGGILLPPYEYGFIGGAAGVDGDTVYFLGDITTHPSSEEIILAITSEGMSYKSLGSGALIDLGGILFAEGEVN